MAKKYRDRDAENSPRQEREEPGWWNDFFRRVTYVQNDRGQWHAEGRTWPPVA